MDSEAYLTGLNEQDRARANTLANEYGKEAFDRRIDYHLGNTLDELESELKRDRGRVRTRVQGLYESIDVTRCPIGWTITNNLQTEADGTRVVQTDVIGPNGATGFFERGYNAAQQRIELRNAFLRLRGMTDELPSWVSGIRIPLVANRGTPTVQYFTLYQLKLLGVPAGLIRLWWRLLHWIGLRSGPFAEPGLVTSIQMSTIQNVEAIVHLCWLRQRHPTTDLSDLVAHTASAEYAATTSIQCGYRVTGTRYVVGKEWESEIGALLDYFEDGNLQRKADNDVLLARYSFDRQTVMKQNFDIELSVAHM